jgi:hypothetical protein
MSLFFCKDTEDRIIVRRAFYAVASLSPSWRWVIWFAFVIAWTTALLVPKPFHAGNNEIVRISLFVFAKTVHVAAYASFTILTCWLGMSTRLLTVILGFLVFHAGLTEYLQYVMDIGREGCIRDVVINEVSILAGLAIWWRFINRPRVHGEPAAGLVPPDPDSAAEVQPVARAR